MADFAGYNMPIVYSTISEEHEQVRKSVGVFDVSHMGEFIVRGIGATEFLQSITSNDVTKLEIGDAQYSCLPNDNGGIVDDLLVYRLPEDQCSEGEQAYMLVVNASNIQKDWEWIESKNSYEANMIDISGRTGLIAVQGPKAVEVLQQLTDVDLAGIPYYKFKKGMFAGQENVLISATGYTGSGGFELYVAADQLAHVWHEVMKAGEDQGILPCGLGARDTLRLEMGYCLYGNDIDDTTSPLEAGLGWITKLKVESDFTSKHIFLKQKEEGLSRRLVALHVEGRRVPRQGYAICDVSEKSIGHITSGTQSPTLDKPIAMGYVPTSHAKVDTEVLVQVGKKYVKATVTRAPFVTI